MLADIVKIHCLRHRVNFPMSRTSNVVVCKEGGEEHVLSDNFPHNGHWIYCCNCQTFIAWDPNEASISVKECPFCLSSLNPRMYACDNCAVTMIDFDDQTLRKHHTVLSWGMPQPACPGCHQFPQSTPKVHFCPATGYNVSTARDQCPYCYLNTAEMAESGAVKTRGLVGSTVSEAQARARDAEDRRRQNELSLQAEKKTPEIDKKVTLDNNSHGALPLIDSTVARQEVELALARAEQEARARTEAEAKAREAEARRFEAIKTAEHEAEMRAAAEVKAREMAGIYTSRLHQLQEEAVGVTGKDKVSIALYAAIAMFLLLALIMLIITMFRLSTS